jgi:hypothetical protein
MLLSELAEMAAALVLNETWARDPGAGVSATCPNPSASNPFWILKMKKARKMQVNSNAGATFFSRHFRGANAVPPRVPFDRGNVPDRPGVYATEEDALKDAVRFRLWVEVGFEDVKKVLEEMAKNHAAAHAAFVNQTKRVATWATRVVKNHTREVKKVESKKRKRQSESRLRYQEAYNNFKEQEGALSGGEDVLRNTRYEVVLAPTDAGAKGNKGVHVSEEFANLRERFRHATCGGTRDTTGFSGGTPRMSSWLGMRRLRSSSSCVRPTGAYWTKTVPLRHQGGWGSRDGEFPRGFRA